MPSARPLRGLGAYQLSTFDCLSVTEVIAPISPAPYPVTVQDEEGETFMAIITSDMKVGEIITRWPQALEVFHRYGLHPTCGGIHTVAYASVKHAFNLEEFLAELNTAVEDAEVSS
jgi:hypothetical protein